MLRVSTDVQYGNACDISVNEFKNSAEVYFSASPSEGSQCLWFSFRITTDKKLKFIKLVLKHPYNMLMGSCNLSNILPVVKKDDGQWQRIEKTYQFHTFSDGRYEISWILNKPGRINDIALCYPYGTPEIEELLKDCRGFWKKDTIGVSTENRSIIRLSNDYSSPGSKKPGIYIVARQHSGETPGSWVLDGLMRYLADIKTRSIVVWAIPLSNIDGIEKGIYGKDFLPFDLNRSWGLKAYRHENLVIQRDIARWIERCIPLFGLDLHAPGGAEGDGIYFPFRKKGKITLVKKKENVWIELIGKTIGPEYMFSGFKKDYPLEGDLKNLTGLMLTSYFGYVLKIPGLCLEIPYGISKNRILTLDNYREIGKRIAIAILKGVKCKIQ
ncbi:MAG: M14 family zinc carboxypeptidase [bacterium]|nr:M14 family zinc carboxypeptidase [bacterium]